MNKTQNIRIIGGRPLSGTIRVVPNKNGILVAIAASLLTDELMTYVNVPRSPDVEKMLMALKDIGAEVEDTAATITIRCKDVHSSVISGTIIKDMQAGYLFAAPLLARFGEATIPIASGCALGYRGPEGHIEYFNELGVSHSYNGDYIHFKLEESINDERLVERNSLDYIVRSATYTQPKVTPTENAIMLLAKNSRCRTKISGIAQEPHVVQLTQMLRAMGATIEGEGSTLTILGTNKLKGVTFVAEPDHIDYFGCVVMSVMTKSDILLEMGDELTPGIVIMNKFIKQMGIKIEIEGGNVRVLGSLSAYAPDDTFPKEKNGDQILYLMNPGPWPAFPVDGLPSFIALSAMNTNMQSSTLTNNWMYRDGLTYVSAMEKMGASIGFYDNQRVEVKATEGNPFATNHPTIVEAPKVIEGSRAIIYCAMAGGEHVINEAQYILRRSPEFFELHRRMGAIIEMYSPLLDTGNGHA